MLKRETILCGDCLRPPEMPKRRQPADEVRCASCGQTDALEYVLDSARRYATHHAALSQDRAFVAQGRDLQSRTPKRAPIKCRRWITGVVDRTEGTARTLSALSTEASDDLPFAT